MKKINLDNQTEIAITKLGIGKYKDLFASLKTLPSLVADLDQISTEEILKKLPTIISTSVDELADVVLQFVDQKETPFTKDQMLGVGLDEFIKIVEAILEVNNAEYILTALKKAMAVRGQTKPSIGTTGSIQ